MKSFFVVLMLVLLSSSVSYGASEDVYVRQDVFDAKMEALFVRLHGEIEALGNKIDGNIKALSERIDGNFMALSNRIDGLEKRIDGFDKRIDDLRNNIYLWTVIIGLIVLFPFVKKWYDEREEKKRVSQPSFTLEDVKRLIAEAKLGAPQI